MRQRFKFGQGFFYVLIVNAKMPGYGDGGGEIRKVGPAGQCETIVNLFTYIIS